MSAQVCTEYEEQLASYGGISDMFWTEVYDHAAFMSYCQQRFGVWPKQRFAKVTERFA